MKVTTDTAVLDRTLDSSARNAATAFEADVRASLPRRSGRTAAQTRVVETSSTPDQTIFAVVGPPQLGPLEQGADVGSRRGPHMGGQHRIASVVGRFGERLVSGLRGAG